MKLNLSRLDADFKDCVRALFADLPLEEREDGLLLIAEKDECVRARREDGKLILGSPARGGYFRALYLALKETEKGDFDRKETCTFEYFGAMADCSRDAVPAPDALKRLIRLLAVMGYNELQLYTEDTFTVPSEPYLGYLRGRYTQAELKELDAYAARFGIELVPCVQTLAHYTASMRWAPFAERKDCDDILLAGDEKTYEFLERVFASLAECFSSRRVNIGMDEAHMLGLGKYLDRNGYRDRFAIMLDHLDRVCRIAARYGFRPMMWSDMFFRLANSGEYYAHAGPPESVTSAVPEGVTLLYWDYYSTDRAHFDRMLRAHGAFRNPVGFAGGAWKWSGFTPHNAYSFLTVEASLSACADGGVKQALITMWGDNGGEASMFSVLPTLCYAAEKAYGGCPSDPETFSRAFAALSGMSAERFLLLDSPDRLIDRPPDLVNPSKYLLYNDCFLGVFDSTVADTDAETYARYAAELKRNAGDAHWGGLFATAAALCDALAVKADLGLKTRAAYGRGDRAAALELARKDYPLFLSRLETFYDAFSAQWTAENKPHGFNVHDLRLGGLMRRTEHCRRRLEAYGTGACASVPELEETLLDYETGKTEFSKKPVTCNCWQCIATSDPI